MEDWAWRDGSVLGRDKARGMGHWVLPDWLAGADFVLQMGARASECDNN